MDINEKLTKAEKKLQSLKEQRAVLDEKIKKTENEIERCNSIINQKKFSEVSQVLNAKGLTIDEIMRAVQAGDMLSLQERMEEITKENTDSVLNANTSIEEV